MGILILTVIFLIGTLAGFCFLSSSVRYAILYITGAVIWLEITFVWWFPGLLKGLLR